MIDASKFAKPHIVSDGRHFHFATGSAEQIAAQIRLFAQDVEDGRILIHRVQCGSAASADDFTLSGLYFEYSDVLVTPSSKLG